jgi:hypothetical protein
VVSVSDLFDQIVPEVEECPTAEAGVIVLVTRIRWAIEARNGELHDDGLRALAIMLNERVADLADAVVAGTPTEPVSRSVAAALQAEDPDPEPES